MCKVIIIIIWHQIPKRQTSKILEVCKPLIKEQLAKGYSIGEIQNLISEQIHLFSVEYRLLHGVKTKNAKKCN